MSLVTLRRNQSTNEGTFGTLEFGGVNLCYTCEPPWLGNEQGDSCVPEGVYTCVPHSGPKFKNVWELEDVPAREAILIHTGNTIRDTHGCILVGLERGTFMAFPAVLQSRLALLLLRKTLPSTFELRITNAFSTPT